jgi:hypothetical protein
MGSEYRGGNSRLLAKSLDELGRPLAILDWRGEILFASADLCDMAKADATQLVGKRCSWELAVDDAPYAALLTALAPPASALEGQIVGRQLTAPIVFGSTATGQLFVPVRDSSNTLALVMVLLGDWEEIKSQLPMKSSAGSMHSKTHDEVLVRLRSQWQNLDSLLPLLGDSPAIRLAMHRAQLAMQLDSHLLVTGPAHIGKIDVVRGVYFGRLKRIGVQRVAGQLFPLDCSALDAELLIGMLDVYSSRLRSNVPKSCQLLVLEKLDQMESEAVVQAIAWVESHAKYCVVAATSTLSLEQLCQRGTNWNRLVTQLAATEIVLPGLSARKEDLGILTQQILATLCTKQGRSLPALSAEALDRIIAYPWPENLAELQRCVADMLRHAVFSAAIQSQHLPVSLRSFAGGTATQEKNFEPIQLDEVLLDLERIIISRAVKLSPRNRARAARWLGISRPRLLRRLAQLGLVETTQEPPIDTSEEE